MRVVYCNETWVVRGRRGERVRGSEGKGRLECVASACVADVGVSVAD